MRLALALLAMATAGCSTPFQDLGFAGGVAAHQVTADTYRIEARGSEYTTGTTLQDDTLLKAAETTRAAGGTHFLIVGAADAPSTGHVTKPESAPTPAAGKTAITGKTAAATKAAAVDKTAAAGQTAVTASSPAMAHSYIKPGQDTYFRVLTIKPGQPLPPGAFLADEVIEFVGKRVKRE